MNLPADWLPRVRAALRPAPDHDPEHWHIAGQPLAGLPRVRAALPSAMATEPQAAAVLVPIIAHTAAPSLLLTTRADHLRQHAGQISFPGGRIEPGDPDVIGAALREAREEVGIEARFVEPLGFLPDQLVLTGFRITPVVALLHEGYTLRVDATEVAEVFELPLEFLSHAANFQPTRRVLRGVEFTLDDLPYQGRVIWGATAGMLQLLHTALRGNA